MPVMLDCHRTRGEIEPWLWGLAVLLLTVSSALAQQVRPGAAVPVYIEDSPAAQELLDEARQLKEQGRLAQAVIKYQQVIDQYGSKLMAVAPTVYTDASLRIQRELLADPTLLETYRRLQEPLATRALAEAKPGGEVNVAAMGEVAQRFGLTASGMLAALDLAATYLERAAFTDAVTVLDAFAAHPDMKQHAARWHLLQAAAGLYGQWDARFQKHRAALKALGVKAEIAQLEGWIASRQPMSRPGVVGLIEPAPASKLPAIQREALWQISTVPGESSEIMAMRTGQLSMLRVNPMAPTAEDYMVPLVESDRLYLNDAETISVLNRISGRPLWVYRARDLDLPETARIGAVGGGRSQVVPDARSVAVDGTRVAAVVGRASTTRSAIRGGMYRTWLVCLSHDDGAELWRLEPANVDETLTRGYFHGTPILADERVYAMVRRSQMSGFHSAFVIAVDARDGAVLWRRHLSSAVPGRSGGAQLLTQMLLRDGRLYLSDNLGSVACLDSRTGAAIWLSVSDDVPAPQHPAVINLRNAQVAPQMMGSPPMLVDAGLVVQGLGSDSGAWVLDPATGKRIRALNEESWQQAMYLAPAPAVGDKPAGIVTVGRQIDLIDGATLTPRWSCALNTEQRRQPIGRPTVTHGHVIVPVGGDLLILSLADGRPVTTPLVDVAGNVIVLDDQLIVTSRTVASGYMIWEEAAGRLTRQIADQPADPDPGMALAYLSLRNEQWDAMMQGVDAAQAALDRQHDELAKGASAQVYAASARRVFNEIRAMVDRDGAVGVPMIEQMRGRIDQIDPIRKTELFARLHEIANGPADVVAYHLAIGRFLRDQGKPAEAVAHFQTILMDRALAAQDVAFNSGTRQAGLEATLRLQTLIKDFSADVYREYDAMASGRLARLAADTSSPATAYIELAEQFPLAAAAPAARAAAAEILAQEDRPTEAIIQLRWAYADASDMDLIRRVVGRLVELYERQDQPARARRMLQRARADYPDLQPLLGGRPMDIAAWLEQLQQRTGREQHLPSLDLPTGEPIVVAGRLLSPQSQPRRTWPTDLILTTADNAVTLHAAPGFDKQWTVALPAPDVRLLSLTREQVLLWFPASSSLMAIETPTGKVAWRADDLGRQIQDIAGEALTLQQRQFKSNLGGQELRVRNGRIELNRLAIPEGCVAVTSEMVVCVADYTGRAIAIDRHGGNILWRHRLEVERLDQIIIDDEAIAVAGTTVLPDANDTESGLFLILDPFTGQKKLPQQSERDKITWMAFADAGVFLYASASSIGAMAMESGKRLWRIPVQDRAITARGVVGESSVMLQESGGTLLLVDTHTGQLLHRSPIQSDALTAPTLMAVRGAMIEAGSQQWHLLSQRNAEARGLDGRLLWRDAISDDQRLLITQLLGEQYVAVVSQVAAIDTAHYRVYLLDRITGVIRAVADLPPETTAIDPESAVFLEQALAFSTAEQTVILPGKR